MASRGAGGQKGGRAGQGLIAHRSMQPTFQSTDESVSRDAPKINGFPVPGGTTPSRGFLEGSVGRLRDRPSGVSGASGAVDEFERGR